MRLPRPKISFLPTLRGKRRAPEPWGVVGAPLAVGQVIDGRYTIRQQIGHGGFGRTYLATDSRRHNEPCVLKEFAPLSTTDAQGIQKARELFQREAAVLHRLSHAQIPQFREEFEIEVKGQTHWMLVQEWIEGPTYLDLLQFGAFPEIQVIQFLRDFLPVLDYLHNHNPAVIHRDIALDNILLSTRTSRPVLIDFGTVKHALHSASASLPQQRTFIAKKGYSPPEQSLGEAYPSSDLYALGVCAIALLTGQRNPAELYDPHQDRWLWQQQVIVSPGLAMILTQLLQTQPEQRFHSAAEVLAALHQLAAQAQLRTLTEFPPSQFSSSPFSPTQLPPTQLPPTQCPPSQFPSSQSSSSPFPPTQIPPSRLSNRFSPRPVEFARETTPLPAELAPTEILRPANMARSAETAPFSVQKTVAIGRSLPQTITIEPTRYIWPLWVRPLLWIQPLLSFLAFRVGPSLLVLLVLYSGVRRVLPSIAQGQLPQLPPLPEWPAIALPPLPDINLPPLPTELPPVQWPAIELPDIPFPVIEFPALQWPTFQFPTLQRPAGAGPLGTGLSNPQCQADAIARFNQLPAEKASWQEVDEQFRDRYPEHTGAINPSDPKQTAYVEAWCDIANQWLDQVN